VEPEVIEDHVMKNLKGSSKTLGTADLKSLINSGKCERMKWKGIVATSHNSSASQQTHQRYAMDIALSGICNGTLSICNNDNLTTDLRNTAGNSLRSVMSYLICVCNSHFIVGDAPSFTSYSKLKLKLSPGAKKKIKMMQQALRVPVHPIEPENVLSTDDTTEYIFHGKRASKDPWRIVEGAARASRGVKSFNHVDPTNVRYGGFRIKLTVTMSAAGQMSSLVIFCSGLSEDELNIKFRGMFVKKNPGLTPTGVLLPTSDDYGYIVFQRSNCCADESRHRYYNEEVIKTFIKSNIKRKRLLRQIPVDSPRTVHETVCSWRDGDVPQINSLVKSGELHSSERT
jgi:hypothetical protein